MSVFRSDHEAAVVRVHILEAELARLEAERDHASSVEPPAQQPRGMTLAEWFVLAGFVSLGLLSCAALLVGGH